jgi:hypothetical protein
MSKNFSRALGALFSSAQPRAARRAKPAPAPVPPEDPLERRRKWFATFAKEQVMPLLEEVVRNAKKHNAKAACELHEVDGRLAAELMLVRGELPPGSRPPRLTIYPSNSGPPLMIEFTGSFPHVGALGGFGGEVDYDPIYPDQLEEKVLAFVELVSGAGAPLR